MRALVIAHGTLRDINILKTEAKKSDVIICADGGAEYADMAGIIPSYLFGDMDSIPKNVLEKFQNSGKEIVQFPTEKDDTDTEICVKKAIALGCSEICIVAGVGDRIDHSLGNVGLLHYIAKSGAKGYIINDDCTIYLCTDNLKVEGKEGDTVSIIPFYREAHGITTKNLYYPLKDDDMEFGVPRGVSNVMTHDECEVSVREGEVLVIRQNNI